MAISFKTYFLSFTIFCLSSSPCVKSLIPHLKLSKQSFTIDIIHRDSMKSPLFDSTKTHFQRTHDALLRSKERAKHLFHKNASVIDVDISVTGHGLGEYIMQYSLGHPMHTTYGFIDPGNGLSWVQCKPATVSYDQGFLPFLDTNINRGLTPVYCYVDLCTKTVKESVSRQYCGIKNCQCKYMIVYADRSATSGDVFYTSLTLQTITGDHVGFSEFLFGCSRDAYGDFVSVASGIIGFGRQPGSFISQIYNQIGGIFGYCLVPPFGPNIYSQMKFGQSAVVDSGPDVTYTQILPSQGQPNLYFINLQAISVGNRRMQYILQGDTGNLLVDSGAFSNFLPLEFYSEFESAVEAELDLLYQRSTDSNSLLTLCYLQDSIEEMRGPVVTFHLSGGDLVLSPENIYLKIADGVVCLNFQGRVGTALLGAMGQTNFMVTYDLPNSMISFKKMNCAIQN